MTLLGITSGTGQVRVASSGPCGSALRLLTRIPLVGDLHAVRLEIKSNAQVEDQVHLDPARSLIQEEVWTRRFGADGAKQPMLRSRLRPGTDGTLYEHWGPVAFVFEPKSRGRDATLKLRHSQIGPWRLPRRWLNIRVQISVTARGTSRTAVEIQLLGGRAANLRYVADIVSEETR